MTSTNDITGDRLVTKTSVGEAKKSYDDAYDRTFGNKRKASVWVLGEEAPEVAGSCCGCCGKEEQC